MNHANNVRTILDRFLERFGKPPLRDVESARERVWQSLSSDAEDISGDSPLEPLPDAVPVRLRDLRLAPAAAVVAVLVLLSATLVRNVLTGDALVGSVENVDGALYRVLERVEGVEGQVQALRVGDRLAIGETIRSNGGSGGAIALADGSRVEMRSQSEFSVEHADDGLRIRLIRGSIIVNAARQGKRHLYVQTKDVTVSVVGTVFLVNAEVEGSRVAVIEGEVRVQQGATSRKLLPGDQVSTNPLMESQPVSQEIAWSRHAEAHMAMLQQSASALPERREAFEVVSIRGVPGGGGGGGGRGDVLPNGFPPACGGSLRIDPRRFFATRYTVYQLIALAYGKSCLFWEEQNEADGLSGGPEWIRSARFDIEAAMPEGPPAYTTQQLNGGMSDYEPGPRLQEMLQTMLEDRFKLVLRPVLKEMPVYTLSVAKGGSKLTAWKEGEWIGTYLGIGAYDLIRNGPDTKKYGTSLVGAISGGRLSMAQLADQLGRMTGRQVLDRTGIAGDFNYELFFAPGDYRSKIRPRRDAEVPLTSPSLAAALEQELGLTLESAREKVEVMVIDRVERPTEN